MKRRTRTRPAARPLPIHATRLMGWLISGRLSYMITTLRSTIILRRFVKNGAIVAQGVFMLTAARYHTARAPVGVRRVALQLRLASSASSPPLIRGRLNPYRPRSPQPAAAPTSWLACPAAPPATSRLRLRREATNRHCSAMAASGTPADTGLSFLGQADAVALDEVREAIGAPPRDRATQPRRPRTRPQRTNSLASARPKCQADCHCAKSGNSRLGCPLDRR